MANAIDFRKDTNAILVGEPIGERPNRDAPAVLPDVRIDPSWPDFQAGRDPALEWILEQPVE